VSTADSTSVFLSALHGITQVDGTNKYGLEWYSDTGALKKVVVEEASSDGKVTDFLDDQVSVVARKSLRVIARLGSTSFGPDSRTGREALARLSPI